MLGRKLSRQLIATRLAIELVLCRVGGLGLLEDLARELLVVEGRIAARVRVDLGPVDRDLPPAEYETLNAPAGAALRSPSGLAPRGPDPTDTLMTATLETN